MDAQFFRELRNLWSEHGGNFGRWPDDAKRSASLLLFQSDERCPDSAKINWVADALSDLACTDSRRKELVRAIENTVKMVNGPVSPEDRGVLDIGSLVAAALVCYPFGWLDHEIREREPEWIMWRRREDEKLEADSQNEARA